MNETSADRRQSMMDDLDSQLRRSYEQHPDFRFSEPPLEIDGNALEAFNNTFEFVRNHRVALTNPQRAESRARCLRALAEVFESLRNQAADDFERRFLTELQAECARLVSEELSMYARRPSGRGISMGAASTQADATRLDRNSHYFGVLPRSAVDEIVRIGSADIAEFRERAKRARLTREDLSVNAGRQVREIVRVLNREFGSLGVLDAVSAYMGRRMAVGGLALELSVPQADWWANTFADLPRAPATLYAHFDESIAFPKSIVYLSDVDSDNGPTSCYRQAYQSLALKPLQEIVGRVIGNVGSDPASPLKSYYVKQYHQSANSERFRRHFMRLPATLRFNSHFGWDILPDSDAEKNLMAREDLMLGPAGTFIVFDGAKLLHRGGMVRRLDRIALQVIFARSTLSSRVAGKLRKAIA